MTKFQILGDKPHFLCAIIAQEILVRRIVLGISLVDFFIAMVNYVGAVRVIVTEHVCDPYENSHYLICLFFNFTIQQFPLILISLLPS